jgi:hypothetical protein
MWVVHLRNVAGPELGQQRVLEPTSGTSIARRTLLFAMVATDRYRGSDGAVREPAGGQMAAVGEEPNSSAGFLEAVTTDIETVEHEWNAE